MQRRYLPDSSFSRRDAHSGMGGREENRTVDLFYQFRQFKSYLKQRLKKIREDRREREFQDEVEDIRHYLSVMCDMSADENHGAEQLQSYIDRIHDMVRKNPLNDGGSITTISDEEEEPTAPRSPSPTEIGFSSFSSSPQAARNIPLERERQTSEFSYFEQMDNVIMQGHKRQPSSQRRGAWDVHSDPYNTNGPSQDVDMRSGTGFRRLSTTPTPSAQDDSPWSPSNSRSFGRGITRDGPPAPPLARDENRFDWNTSEQERNYPSSGHHLGYRRDDNSFNNNNNNNRDPFSSDPWQHSRSEQSYNSFAQGRGERSFPNNYTQTRDRHGNFPHAYGEAGRDRDFVPNVPRENNYPHLNENQPYVREFNRREPIERQHSQPYHREPAFDPPVDTFRSPKREESLPHSQFERRPTPNRDFDRRRQPSKAAEPDDAHIDYNHGGNDSQKCQNPNPWIQPQNTGDRDMRFLPTSTPLQQPQLFPNKQQNSFNTSPFNLPNPAPQGPAPGSIPPLSNVNVTLPALTVRRPQASSVPVIPQFVPPPLQQQPKSSLLGTPPVQPPNYNHPDHGIPTQPTDTFARSSNDGESESNAARLNELFRQKAQENFKRRNMTHRNKDPRSRNGDSTSKSNNVPSNPPQGKLIASNQMVSDPRLRKAPYGNSSSHPHNSTATSQTQGIGKDRVIESSTARKSDSEKNRESTPVLRDPEKDGLYPRPTSRISDSALRQDIQTNERNSSGAVRDNRDRDRIARMRMNQEKQRPDSRRLDDARNRVKDKLIAGSSEPNRLSKLQEIRKQVEIERLALLGVGRPGAKKTSSFDDAIQVAPDVPMRPPSAKDATKVHKIQDASARKEATDSTSSNRKDRHKEKRSDEGFRRSASRDKSREKSSSSERYREDDSSSDTETTKGKERRRVSEERGKTSPSKADKVASRLKIRSMDSGKSRSDDVRKKRDGRNHKSKSKQQGTSEGKNPSVDPESQKKIPFKIPKIKKPDPPPPPPRSPTPEPEVEETQPESPEYDTPRSPAANDNNVSQSPEVSAVAREKLKLITDDFITQFVSTEVEKSAADQILKNPVVVQIIKERLRNQILEIFKDGPSDLLAAMGPDDRRPPLPSTESEVTHADIVVESEEPTVPNTTKKRHKRELEKLHDALKEMNFDTMLPLGPRRCTRGPDESAQDHTITSPIDKEGTVKGSETKGHSTLAKKQTSLSKLAEAAASKTMAANKEMEEATTSTAGTQKTVTRGRKRKRGWSKVKSNKKPKGPGPVTRAQAAVKTAKRIRKKDTAKLPDDKNKNTQNGDGAADDKRVTRSMKKKRIGGPRGKAKVKVEPPEVKTEPTDNDTTDAMNIEDTIEQDEGLFGSAAVITEEDIDINQQLASINFDISSFDNDDLEDRMSIDIKSEPGSPAPVTVETALDEEESPEKILLLSDEEMLDDDKIETGLTDNKREGDNEKIAAPDTDYNTDLSDFLPDIPTIDAVYSVGNDEVNNIDALLNQIEHQIGASPEVPPSSGSRSPTLDVQQVCQDVMDNILDEVEYLEPEGESVVVAEVDTEYETESEEDSEELNDFFSYAEEAEVNDKDPVSVNNSNNNASENLQSVTSSQDADGVQGVITKNAEDGIKKIKLESDSTVIDKDVITSLDNMEIPITTSSVNDNRMRQTAASDSDKPDPGDDCPFAACNPTLLDRDVDPGRTTDLQGTDLYVCPNSTCGLRTTTSNFLKDHLITCTLTPENKTFSCRHCDKRLKGVGSMIEHLKTHGVQRQCCCLCEYKTWLTAELARHMKAFHKVYTHKVEKVGDSINEDEQVFYMYPKEVGSRISNVDQLKEAYARYADRLVFGPDDIEKVPSRQIFQTLAYCSFCSYSSKVRINFIRHLQAHKKADEKPEMEIPCSDPVNPVPCLERKELMFDKMTNWAGSSHENKQGSTTTDNTSLPQFVLEQFRYECCEEGCAHITVDEYMLRAHIRTLHPEVDSYKCPHCWKQDGTRTDPRNAVPVDRLGNHLKLHGPKLYRCAYCDAIHTQVTMMEKHLPEKHPERKPIHYLIRNLDPEGNATNRRNSTEDGGAVDKWRCGLCTTKQVFSNFGDVKGHCTVQHKISAQFICFHCKHGADSDVMMFDHLLKCSERNNEEERILIMWYRNDFDPKSEDIIHGPLWKRSTSVKHIRGIFLEDVKERTPKWLEKVDGSPTKQSSTTLSPSGDSVEPSKTTTVRPKTYVRRNFAKKNLAIPSSLPFGDGLIEYTCPKCKVFKTRTAVNMRVHLYNELRYQRYRCTKCNVKFITESSLKGHITGDHGAQFAKTAFEVLPPDTEVEHFIEGYFASHVTNDKDKVGCWKGELPIPPSLEENSDPPTQDDSSAINAMFTCKHCKQQCQTPHNLKTHLLAKHLATDRFACRHCNSSFWSEKVVKSHHYRQHSELPYSVEAKFALNLTPEFWKREYGIHVKQKRKKPVIVRIVGASSAAEPDTNNVVPIDLKGLESTENDDFLFDFPTVDEDLLLDDEQFSLPPNDFGGDILQQLFSENVDQGGVGGGVGGVGVGGGGGGVADANRNQNVQTYAYKCFHCPETSLSMRGARSHWEKSHSNRPEERCNYYEYKCFNEKEELPPCIQLTCTFCDYCVSSLPLLYNHHNGAHPSTIFKMRRKLRMETVIFVCEICQNQCCAEDQITKHLRRCHPSMSESAYARVDLRAKLDESGQTFMGKLVEDLVKYNCDQANCKFESESRLITQSHTFSEHGLRNRKAGIKYSRFIINSQVKVPLNDEAIVRTTVFKCPACDYTAEERQKLVTDHLGEHVHTYSCPCASCTRKFKTYTDGTFHIRHQHAEPNLSPQINPDLLRARLFLENSIEQVQVSR